MMIIYYDLIVINCWCIWRCLYYGLQSDGKKYCRDGSDKKLLNVMDEEEKKFFF